VPDRLPIVLLHPFPLDAGFWHPVSDALAADRVVLTPEFPGLGGSPSVPAPTVDRFADLVANRIAREAGGRAVVCGLSLGGYAALSLAARHPERVAALILANTRAEPDAPEAVEGRHASAHRVRTEGPGEFLDELIPGFIPEADAESRAAARAIAGAQAPEAVARALEALAARPDRRPDLAGMAVPALVIVGSEDAITPLHFAETLVDGLPDAELVVIEGAGHLTALERPEEFTRIVRGFLERRGL
jgi:pimeloyl-ACP methyl ester carboxylesterase